MGDLQARVRMRAGSEERDLHAAPVQIELSDGVVVGPGGGQLPGCSRAPDAAQPRESREDSGDGA